MSILPLTVTAATVQKAGRTLLGPVDLTLDAGGVTIVIGPNGAGKSTLLRLLHGLDRPAQGNVRWALPRTKTYKRQSFVFQSPILMRRSVTDCIAYPLIVHGTARADARKEAAIWADRVGLGDHKNQRANSLSGGERQKMALARALITSPEVLFLDEPCASLDGRAIREIETILVAARDSGTRIVMSTHDMGQARRLADDILFLHHGKIVEASVASDFFPIPTTKDARMFLKGDILE